MRITLEHNHEETSREIPYFARIEIVAATVDYHSVFQVPVYRVETNGKSIYNLEICGFRLETERPEDIPLAGRRLLSGLVNMARLPSYVFIARRAGEIYPVYTVGNEVLATTRGGPVFRHVELAYVRQYLSDYLHAVGILGAPGRDDKLHVRGVSMSSLALRRPIFYLKKRVPGQMEFWSPVFESANGRAIYTYAANARREAFIEDGRELFKLCRMVAEVLMADKRLQDACDLRPDRLFPDYWQSVKATLSEQMTLIHVADIGIPLYRVDDLWIGLEHRPDENRYSLFLGRNVSDVEERVTQDFSRRGFSQVARREVLVVG